MKDYLVLLLVIVHIARFASFTSLSELSYTPNPEPSQPLSPSSMEPEPAAMIVPECVTEPTITRGQSLSLHLNRYVSCS